MKMSNIKKVMKKSIILILVFIILFNMNLPIISNATVDLDDDFESVNNTWENAGGAIIDGIVGVLTWVFRAPAAASFMLMHTLATQLCGIDGDGVVLTAEDIIFTGSSRSQQASIININFFDFKGSGAKDNVVLNFRLGVAKWYYALRNISIVLSLAVLVYIGIRMAISSVASDKAMYKTMLVNWTMGFAILFLLHYFIVLVINANNGLVDLIYSISGMNDSGIIEDYMGELMKGCFSPMFIKGIGSLILYMILVGTTLALFIMYMKRLFTIGFLIVISPLITVTYSIDKLGDGKSQALDTWLKEFVYNVLIQPFHCIIYLVFVSTAVNALNNSHSLSGLIFVILSVLFIFKAEDIVKKIFGFEKASSVGGMVAAGAIAANGLGKLGSSAKAAGKVASKSGGTSAGGIQRKSIPSGGTSSTNNNTSTGNKASSKNTNKSAGKQNGGSTGGTSANNGSTKGSSSGSSGTSSSSSANDKKTSAFAKAFNDIKDNVKENINEISADKKGAALNLGKQAILKGVATTAKLAPKLAMGAMVAGATGNGMNGIIAGYSMKGGKFSNKIASLADEDSQDLKSKLQEKRVAAAYEKYRLANSDLSDDELYNKSADLLEADIDMLSDKNEIELAKQLQKMKDNFVSRGMKNADKKVMRKIEGIQAGNVKNSISIKLDNIENAVKDFKTQNTAMADSAIINMSKDMMADIEKAKSNNEKYLKSKDYLELDKEKQDLAKKIFKSKEVLDAIGNVNKDVINKEIEDAIERGLEKNN